MKKVFSVIILAAILIFARNNFAHAQDVYVGTYSDRSEAYLVTESIKAKYFFGKVSDIDCNVKIVMRGQGKFFVKYIFYKDRYGTWTFSENGTSKGECTKQRTPIVWNILNQAISYS